MRNIKLLIEYDGTNYCGWQIQRYKDPVLRHKNISIQEILEKKLSLVLKEEIKIIGSGRTDSGVHAFGQVANFKTNSCISVQKIKTSLNAVLPVDIHILYAKDVPVNFHARYSVKSKEYQYFLLCNNNRSAFLNRFSYRCRYSLDAKLMNKASRCLLGRHDFKAFCASGSSAKDTVKNIEKITIAKKRIMGSEVLCISLKADGFLYNMVRNIVGTLIEVGRGRFKPEYVNIVLKSKKRAKAGPCVPAKGLYLVRVLY